MCSVEVGEQFTKTASLDEPFDLAFVWVDRAAAYCCPPSACSPDADIGGTVEAILTLARALGLKRVLKARDIRATLS